MQQRLPPPPSSVDISSTYTLDDTSEGQLGQGSFGTVFRATRNDDASSSVAVKRIKKAGLGKRDEEEVINEVGSAGRGGVGVWGGGGGYGTRFSV